MQFSSLLTLFLSQPHSSSCLCLSISLLLGSHQLFLIQLCLHINLITSFNGSGWCFEKNSPMNRSKVFVGVHLAFCLFCYDKLTSSFRCQSEIQLNFKIYYFIQLVSCIVGSIIIIITLIIQFLYIVKVSVNSFNRTLTMSLLWYLKLNDAKIIQLAWVLQYTIDL